MSQCIRCGIQKHDTFYYCKECQINNEIEKQTIKRNNQILKALNSNLKKD